MNCPDLLFEFIEYTLPKLATDDERARAIGLLRQGISPTDAKAIEAFLDSASQVPDGHVVNIRNDAVGDELIMVPEDNQSLGTLFRVLLCGFTSGSSPS